MPTSGMSCIGCDEIFCVGKMTNKFYAPIQSIQPILPTSAPHSTHFQFELQSNYNHTIEKNLLKYIFNQKIEIIERLQIETSENMIGDWKLHDCIFWRAIDDWKLQIAKFQSWLTFNFQSMYFEPWLMHHSFDCCPFASLRLVGSTGHINCSFKMWTTDWWEVRWLRGAKYLSPGLRLLFISESVFRSGSMKTCYL